MKKTLNSFFFTLTRLFLLCRELAKKSLGMSGQFSTDNINLVIKKSPLGIASRPLTTKMKPIESPMDNEIERDGLRIPKKIDSTWAVSKVLIQKKGKVALKDLRRLNELTSDNQKGLNRQRKVCSTEKIFFRTQKPKRNFRFRKQFFYKMSVESKMKNNETKYVGKQNLVLIHCLKLNEKIFSLVDKSLGMNILFVTFSTIFTFDKHFCFVLLS